MSESTRRGAVLLGFEPHPDQLALGALLDGGDELTAVSWPRRAGKTEGIWMWLVGFCDLNPGANVVVTAQTGAKSRERFLAAARRLERHYPEEVGGPHIRKGAIVDMEWEHGSRLWSVSPDPDNFRGDAINKVLVDEAQSFDVERSENLKQAIPPVLDTVPDGQIILAGTPGPARAGWYWDTLVAGRDGAPGIALSEYRLEEWEDVHDEASWWKVHPGLRHGLTTIEKMRARHAASTEPAWRMEYMGQWPPDAGTDALGADAWERQRVEPVDRPERVGIAFDCAYDGSSASIVYAWRDEAGAAFVEVVRHELGTGWVARAAAQAAVKHKRCPIAHDDIGANLDPATALRRSKPVPKIDRLNTKDAMGAAARFANEVHAGTLFHFGQADLDAGVGNLTWRDIGKSGRAFGRKNPAGAPINPVVAASLALWSFDRQPKRSAVRIVA